MKETKLCTKCGETKDVEEYYRNKGKPDGLQGWCKECIAIDRLANKERDNARDRAWRKANSEKIRVSRAKQYQERIGFPDRLKNIESYWTTYKNNAKQRKISVPFLLTLEQFDGIVSQPCAYCASPSDKYLWEEKRYVNGVDRLDNNLGYTIINSVPCCKQCNYMKRDSTEEQFIEKCNAVSNVSFVLKETANLIVHSLA